MTTQQAAVVVSERVDGAWTTRSTRLDETGHLVGDLVGLNLDQFCQVAMLPQGQFQAFLRARSEDRHKVLQQLFRTSRFEDVEKWLRERRFALRKDVRDPRAGGRRPGQPAQRGRRTRPPGRPHARPRPRSPAPRRTAGLGDAACSPSPRTPTSAPATSRR